MIIRILKFIDEISRNVPSFYIKKNEKGKRSEILIIIKRMINLVLKFNS